MLLSEREFGVAASVVGVRTVRGSLVPRARFERHLVEVLLGQQPLQPHPNVLLIDVRGDIGPVEFQRSAQRIEVVTIDLESGLDLVGTERVLHERPDVVHREEEPPCIEAPRDR